MNTKAKTDPYGSLQFVVGSGDDFICFDYYLDRKRKRVLLHSVVNSETGSFIQDFNPPLWWAFADAIEAAQTMVYRALDWCADNEIRHSRKGWNQDPFYFVRDVAAAIDGRNKPVARISRKQR